MVLQLQQNIDKQDKSGGFESCDRPIVRKCLIWVKMGDILSRVTSKFDGWPWKTIGHLLFAVVSFVQQFIAICEFKLELQSGNAQFGSSSTIFVGRVTSKFDRWHWKTIGHLFYATSSFVHHFVAIGELKLQWQSRNTLLVQTGFCGYHGILVVHLQDSVGAFGAKWLTKWLHHAKAPPHRGILRWEWRNKDVHLVTTFVFCHVSKCFYFTTRVSLWKRVRKMPKSGTGHADAIGYQGHIHVMHWKSSSLQLGNKMAK